VRPERITAAAAQRERVAPDSDLEAAAASLRLGLTLGPGDGEDGDLAADGHMCQVVVEEAMGGGSVWLGAGTAAKARHWFDARGITAVLNVSRDIPNYFERDARFEYHSLRCDDTEGDAQAMGSQLEPALATLERWVGDGRHVLVHCHAGRSRSATVVLAFMMQRGVPLEEAIERVSARRTILPNLGFFELLVGRQQHGSADDAPGGGPLDASYHEGLSHRFVRSLTAASEAAVGERQRRAVAARGWRPRTLEERLRESAEG
jgi:protein-tyrosine phosphatase